MKKLALTNLLLLLMTIKSVSACSLAIDPNNPDFDPSVENSFYSKLYFYPLVFLILANIVLFFVRRQKDYLMLTVIILGAFATITATFLVVLISSCGDGLPLVLKWEFLFFLFLFCFHIILWVNKFDLRIIERKLTELKLR